MIQSRHNNPFVLSYSGLMPHKKKETLNWRKNASNVVIQDDEEPEEVDVHEQIDLFLRKFRPRKESLPNSSVIYSSSSIDSNSILNSNDENELMGALCKEGFSDQVEEYRKHLENMRSNSDEEEHSVVRFDTLKAAARFLIENEDLPFSAIESDFDGHAELNWFLSSRRREDHEDDAFWGEGDGNMVLRFLSPTMIEFAMISGPWGESTERLSLSGTLSHSKMKTVIEMFKVRMVGYEKI